ncbi:MAG: UTP--glucose-1-phosphate uridylyltransferase [Clostridiales bacterium]|nr:UTP--glucose-1-phosphate uridylyltransferase [Clostridiales bacterium]
MSAVTSKNKKITKAVIPAAGLGTRMLPISRAVPKEMLPIVDKPAISYLVEECAASGIKDILIITGRSKTMMEDYFDYSLEYEAKLKESGREDEIPELRRIADLCNIHYIRQLETKGLGHAITFAHTFVGDDPFVVLYGDDIIFSEKPVVKQIIEAYEKYNLPTVGVKEVPVELVMKYDSLKVHQLEEKIYKVETMIEKPRIDQIYSHFSILGRVLLTSEIFDILYDLPPGAGGEIQLTDAMKIMAETIGMIAVDFEGTRYDLGSKIGFLKVNTEQATKNPELGSEFREYLKEFVKTL